MLDLMKVVKSFLQLEKVQTDNNVFKLHYKVTVALLLAFSLLLTSKQYFGDPIDCDLSGSNMDKGFINNYCWIFGTFINEQTVEDKNLPGLGIGDHEDFHHYYQWVCLIFALQAAFFYLPRYLWSTWEGGRLGQLIDDLKNPMVNSTWEKDVKDSLINYLISGAYAHNIYTVRYYFCEVLNFINVLLQILLTDWFIKGNFWSYGLNRNAYEHLNPKIFPKKAKCTYYRYGTSGSTESRDALCILSLNVLNEKVFLILWYWLLVLLILSFMCVIYRSLFLFVPQFRVYLLRALTRKLDSTRAKLIVEKTKIGDFFVLYRIGKNVNPHLYKELIFGLYEYLLNKRAYISYPLSDI